MKYSPGFPPGNSPRNLSMVRGMSINPSSSSKHERGGCRVKSSGSMPALRRGGARNCRERVGSCPSIPCEPLSTRYGAPVKSTRSPRSVDPTSKSPRSPTAWSKPAVPALFFEDVKGSAFPVLTNQFGSQRRMAMAFDASALDAVAARLRALLDLSPPGASWGEKFDALKRFAPLANAIPKTVRDAPVPRSRARAIPTCANCPC